MCSFLEVLLPEVLLAVLSNQLGLRCSAGRSLLEIAGTRWGSGPIKARSLVSVALASRSLQPQAPPRGGTPNFRIALCFSLCGSSLCPVKGLNDFSSDTGTLEGAIPSNLLEV